MSDAQRFYKLFLQNEEVVGPLLADMGISFSLNIENGLEIVIDKVPRLFSICKGLLANVTFFDVHDGEVSVWFSEDAENAQIMVSRQKIERDCKHKKTSSSDMKFSVCNGKKKLKISLASVNDDEYSLDYKDPMMPDVCSYADLTVECLNGWTNIVMSCSSDSGNGYFVATDEVLKMTVCGTGLYVESDGRSGKKSMEMDLASSEGTLTTPISYCDIKESFDTVDRSIKGIFPSYASAVRVMSDDCKAIDMHLRGDAATEKRKLISKP